MHPDARPRPSGTVHIIGAGPVGLFLAALLQDVDGLQVRLVERRPIYTRMRWVALADYLTADSIDAYAADAIDGQDVAAIYEPEELELRLAYRRTVAADLRGLVDTWTQGFVPIKVIEESLSELIAARGGEQLQRITAEPTAAEALAALGPDDVLVDCTGSHSLFRDLLRPGTPDRRRDWNTRRTRLEYALVVTFLYSEHYACSELCKYRGNVDNATYKFIPGVHRTYYDEGTSHVTGFVTITREDFAAIPPVCDGAYLRANHPVIAASMDRFLDYIGGDGHGHVIGDLEVTRIPLEVHGARNFTSRRWWDQGGDQPLATAPVFLLGDAAIASPYFQSISLGLENAFFLAGHLANRDLSMGSILERYEQFMYRQWLRVFMRSQMIKHNKDLLQSVDRPDELLTKLHIF